MRGRCGDVLGVELDVGGTNTTAHRCSLISACLVSREGWGPGLAGPMGHSPGPRPEHALRLPHTGGRGAARLTGGGQPLSQGH